ncbi:MAG: sodium:solute symporter family protein [Dehalococcoidia bacterium]
MLDIVIVAVYFIGMICIGIFALSRGKASKRDSFFVADRNGSKLIICGSLCATIIGASAVVGMAGLGFSRGLTGAWWLLAGTIGLLVLSAFFARKVRDFGLYTLPELIERQYNANTGIVVAILIVIAWLGVIAAQIVAASVVLSCLVPLSPPLLMIIITSIFIIYTVLGGQYSIIRTDFVQTIILFIGILICTGFLAGKLVHNGSMIDSLPSDFFSFPVSKQFSWTDLIAMIILVGATYVVGPDIYSRLFCAKDQQVARSSAWITALVLIPVAFIIVFIGMGAKVLFPGIAPEESFSTIIGELLPIGISGLVIAALLAAIMSSADTCMLTTSAILTEDIIKRFSSNMPERKELVVTRINIIIIGIISLIIAVVIGGVIKSLLLAYTIFTSGVVIPVIAGFYKEKLKITATGAFVAVIGGGGTALIIKILGINNLDLLGFGVCLILLFLVSRFTYKK